MHKFIWVLQTIPNGN